MQRRQSRPFQGKPLPEDAATVQPPSPELMEHLEGIYGDASFGEVSKNSGMGVDYANNLMHNVGMQAGYETVLGYLRELIARAHGEA